MSHDKWQEILDVVKKLRDPKKGCPWDIVQTQESLTPYAIEEAYELEQAILEGNQEDIISELGDVLFQVILHSEIARQNNKFNIYDVIESLKDKMVRRHPHVFGKTKVKNAKEVIKNWEKIKKTEAQTKKEIDPFGFAKNLPALKTAQKIGKRTNQYRFDWKNSDQVVTKLNEEVRELKDALKRKNKKMADEELGDILFTLAQLGRHLNLDTEKSLRKSNSKFIKRFNKMLAMCKNDIETFIKLPSHKKETLWKKIKK